MPYGIVLCCDTGHAFNNSIKLITTYNPTLTLKYNLNPKVNNIDKLVMDS